MARLVYHPPWRFIVTTLRTETLTFLDRFATRRGLTFTLNAPATARGEVPSDDPEINIVHDDGDPFLEEGSRLLYGFRRETGSPPWVCRFAGPILQINDVVRADEPRSAYTAYDPWQNLYRRPVRRASGALPLREGLPFNGVAGSTIALELLARTIAADGACHIDAGINYGGTIFYGGTIETTSKLDMLFQNTATVGDAWTELAKTGTLDLVLTPIYDPINRPGYCAELSVYETAGIRRNGAVFAWDQPTKTLLEIDRLRDGTLRANDVQPYLQEGYPATEVLDAASIAKFGTYWEPLQAPGDTTFAVVEALAAAELLMKKNAGSLTVKITPAPDLSPVPFVEYGLGDAVPVYASKRFRRPLSPGSIDGSGRWTSMARIYEIPITLDDNGAEIVSELSFTSDDGNTPSEGTTPGGGGSGGGGGSSGGGGGTPSTAIYFSARMDGAFYSAHSALYAPTTSDDAPWTKADLEPNAYSLFTLHAGKAPTAIMWGGQGSAIIAWDDDADLFTRNYGAFSYYTMGASLNELHDLRDGVDTHSGLTNFDALVAGIKATGRPMLFRPLWEMNGDWSSPYNWQRSSLSAADYVTVWRNMWQRCADVMGGHSAGSGLGTDTGNMSWFFCPNVMDGGSALDPTAWDPGHAYYDWTGVDFYNQGGTDSPSSLADSTLAILRALAPGLPIAVGETGCEAPTSYSGGKTKWVVDFFAWLAANPDVKFFNWFNEAGNPVLPHIEVGPLATDFGGATQTAFRTAVSDSRYKAGSVGFVNSTNFPNGSKVPIPS